jgi:hypothetical protein
MPSASAAASPATLGTIDELFDVEDAPTVRRYPGEHPFLVPLLVEARQTIPRFFPTKRVRLQLLTDRDGGDHTSISSQSSRRLSPAIRPCSASTDSTKSGG